MCSHAFHRCGLKREVYWPIGNKRTAGKKQRKLENEMETNFTVMFGG